VIDRIEVLEHAILRVAAWPIDTVDRFAAPGLEALARRALAAEAVVAARRDHTLAALEHAVPTIADRRLRAWLLQAKRHVYSGDAPLPACPEKLLAEFAATAPEASMALADEYQARQELSVLVRSVDREWRAELSRQRDVLRQITLEARFLRALSMANPAVAERWEHRADMRVDQPRSDKARHVRLEASVFRYLMRAAGRATPQGAWAGVAPVSPGYAVADDAAPFLVSEAPGMLRYVATPALEPFATVVAVLARQPRYWADYPLRLNPTAHQVGRNWRYEEAGEAGRRWVEMTADPLAAVILEAYADGEAHRAAPLLDALARLVPKRPDLRDALGETVARLVSRQALQSELILPAAPSGIWDALDAVARRLVEPDRSLWLAVTSRTKMHCDQLGSRFETLSPGKVRGLEAAVRRELGRLLESVDLQLDDNAPVIHLDLRLPLEVTWSPATIEAVRAAVDELLGFHMTIEAAERYRSASLLSIAPALPPSSDVPLLSLLHAAGSRLAWLQRLPPVVTDWDDLLNRAASESSCTLPPTAVHRRPRPGPGGALLLSIVLKPTDSSGGASPIGVRAEWGRPQPSLFVARFDHLLGHNTSTGELADAIAQKLSGWERSGLRAVEIVGHDPINLNAAVRPVIAPLQLEPHGVADLRPAKLSVRLEHDRPWLHCAGFDEKLVPVYGSAAAIGADDPCSRLLLQLAMVHGWELLSLGSPLLVGRRHWPHLPRVALPGGTVLSGERWSLDREAVADLVNLEGPTQYLAWRRHADRMALPSNVWVGFADTSDPERFVLRTDSPLAVRCLLLEMERAPRAVEFVEAHGDPAMWPVVDAEGRHYLAELAVSWFDDSHWQSLDVTANARES
jgi:hypothetical protein